MDRAEARERLKKAMAERQSKESQEKSVSPKTVMSREEARSRLRERMVNGEYAEQFHKLQSGKIQSFLTDSQSFLQQAAKGYEAMDYQSSKDYEKQVREQAAQLLSRRSDIDRYLSAYEDKLDKETVGQLQETLKELENARVSTVGAVADKAAMISGFDTDEDYKAAWEAYRRQDWTEEDYVQNLREATDAWQKADPAGAELERLISERDFYNSYVRTLEDTDSEEARAQYVAVMNDYNRRIAEARKAIQEQTSGDSVLGLDPAAQLAQSNREDAKEDLAVYQAYSPYYGKTRQEVLDMMASMDPESEEYKNAQTYSYSLLMRNKDFETNSIYKSQKNDNDRSTTSVMLDQYSTGEDSGWDDLLYEVINGKEEARAYYDQYASNYYGSDNVLGAIFGRATQSKQEIKQMTANEVAIFNYLYATEGKTAAYTYYDFLEGDLLERDRAAEQQKWARWAESNEAGASLATIPMGLGKIFTLVGQTTDLLTTGEIDKNAAYNKYSYIPTTIRSTVSDKIENSGKWGSVGSFAYNVGMSMGDFAFSTALTGGSSLSLAIMGTGAAADTTLSGLDRGLSSTQAYTLGIIAGAAEVLTEKVSLDTLLDADLARDGLVKYIGKNMVAEGSEEVSADLINTFADILISQKKSQWLMDINSYMEKGYSNSEAFGMAVGDKAKELGLSYLGGAISGGTLGFIAGSVYKVTNKGTNNPVQYSFNTTQETIDRYVDNAYRNENTLDYQKYAVPTQELIEDVGSELDLTGYAHALRDNDIRHIRNSHGEQTNEKYPVTAEDIKKIPSIVQNYDKVYVIKRNNGRTGIVYVKVMADNTVYYLEQATDIYGNEKLLVNKQMIKTGINTIPGIKGLKEAITKKESEPAYLADLKSAKVYVQDVTQTHSKENEPEFPAGMEAHQVYARSVRQAHSNNRVTQRESDVKQNRSTNGPLRTGESIMGFSGMDVAEAGAGKMTLRLPDGKTASYKELSYADESTRFLYEKVAAIAEHREAAQKLLEAYDPEGAEMSIYAAGVEEAYMYGKYGYTQQEMLNRGSFVTMLTPPQIHMAYNLGKIYGKKARFANHTGYVTYTGREAGLVKNIYAEELRETAPKLYMAADRLGRVLKCKIAIDNNMPVGKGTYEKGVIRINAKVLDGSKAGQKELARILIHEVVHRFRKMSPSAYQDYQNAVTDQLRAEGEDILQLIRDKQENHKKQTGESLSREDALEEICADFTRRMMDENGLFKDFISKSADNRKLGQKLAEHLKDFLNRIKGLFSRDQELHQLLGVSLDNASETLKAWNQMLSEVAKAKPSQAVTETGEVKFSLKQVMQKNIDQQFSEYSDGTMSKSDVFYFGKTPAFLPDVGIQEYPLIMTQAAYKKSQTKKDHDVQRKVVKKLLSLLQKPIFSFSENGKIAFLVDAKDKYGRDVIVAINQNITIDRTSANEISSIYGILNPEEWIANQIKTKKFTIFDENKANEYLQRYGYLALRGEITRLTDESISQRNIEVKQNQYSMTGTSDILFGESQAELDEAVEAGAGKMTLRLPDGKTASYKELSYADESTRFLYEKVAAIADHREAAQKLLEAYDPEGAEMSIYAAGVEEAYMYGKYGYTQQEMLNRGSFVTMLTPPQIHMAYNLGKIYGKKARFANHTGYVTYTGREAGLVKNIYAEELRETAPKLYMAADRLGRVLKCKIAIDNNMPVGKGTYEKGVIRINAKVLDGSKAGQKELARILIHEVVHRFRKMSPSAYQDYQNAVTDQLRAEGEDILQLIRDKQENHKKQTGESLSREDALEEICADFTRRMMDENGLFKDFISKSADNRKLGQKLAEHLKDFLNRIKGLFSRDQELHQLLGVSLDNASETLKAWNQMLSEVAKAKPSKAQSGAESVIKYSFQDSESGMANDSLIPYSEELTQYIRNRGDYIVDSASTLEKIVDKAFSDTSIKATAYFGVIKAEILKKIQNSIPNLPKVVERTLFKNGRDYSIAATFDSIRHITSEKGLTKKDVISYLDRLADTIVAFDTVSFDYYIHNKQKMPGILFKKAFSDGVLISFDLISNKKRSVVLQSLYMDNADYQKKKYAETMLMQNAYSHTPKAEVGHTSINSLSKNNNDVKYSLEQAVADSVAETSNTLFGESQAELDEAVEQHGAIKPGENPVREVSETGGKRYAVSNSQQAKYNYSVSFAQQVEDWINGKIPKNDSLIIGKTPEIWRLIGMNSLPVTINQSHIDYALNGTKDADHFLTKQGLLQIPEAIKHPVAIISSKSKNGTSLVAMLDIRQNGKQVIVPVVIDGFGHQNNLRIDSNAVTSVYGKDFSISKVLYNALNDEANGKLFSVYYVDVKKATALLQGARVLMPKMPAVSADGFVHSIDEAGSPVKKKFTTQTDTQQFKRWFGKSKIVDADGNPLVMYHGTRAENGDFTIFDSSKAVKKGGLGLKAMGKGNYFTATKLDGTERYGSRVISSYLSIEKPFIYDAGGKPVGEQFAEKEGIKTENADELQQAMRDKGYDGVVQFARDGSIAVAVTFDSNQTKSATDNIGTFDRSNPDIHYSLTDTSDILFGESQADLDEAVEQHGAIKPGKRTIQEIRDIYSEINLSQDSSLYSYDFLTSLPDMQVVLLPELDTIRTDGRIDTKKVIDLGIKNARTVGSERNGKVYVQNRYTGRELRLDVSSIRHGLNGGMQRLLTNGRLGAVIGEVVQNAVPINALSNTAEGVVGTYAMAQYVTDGKGREFIAIVTIEQREGDISGIEVYDVTHAISGRQKRGSRADTKSQGVYPSSATKKSIADFLNIVKTTHQSILSQDVLNYFRELRNPNGYYTGKVKFALAEASDILFGKSQAELDEAVEQHGAIKPGENPVREVQVPKSIDGKRRISYTVRTALEAGVTPQEMVPRIGEELLKGTFSYQAQSNETAIDYAKRLLSGETVEGAMGFWNGIKRSNKQLTPNQTAVGYVLYNNLSNEAAKAADPALKEKYIQEAIGVLTDISNMVRENARVVQANRILKKLTPEGKVFSVKRAVENLNQRIQDKVAGITLENGRSEIVFPEDLARKWAVALHEGDGLHAHSYEKLLYKSIAKQVKRTAYDYLTAWQYLSMLGNFKTQVRNLSGNVMMTAVKGMKDTIAAGLERVFISDKSQRTKAVLLGKDTHAIKAFAKADFELLAGLTEDAGKYQDSGSGLMAEISEYRRSFQLPGLKHWQQVTKWAMNNKHFGDQAFLRINYTNSFAQICAAKGWTAELLEKGGVAEKALTEARNQAMLEAQKATFRDLNAVSKTVSRLRFSEKTTAGKIANIWVNGIIPFRTTPANIAVRSFEYSPLGLVKTITYGSMKLKKGNISISQYIDQLSAGLTGTGITALGILLAALGVLTGGSPDEDEERKGVQPYSILLGDTSYTIDWLSPTSVPLLVGAALYEDFIAPLKNGAVDVGGGIEAFLNAFQPMLEASFLTGVTSLLDTMQYGDSANVEQLLYACFITPFYSAVSQCIPTLSSQIAGATENKGEKTYVADIENRFLRNLAYDSLKLLEKLPGVDIRQVSRIDPWGRVEESNGWFESFMNPAYTEKLQITEADREIDHLKESLVANIQELEVEYDTADEEGQAEIEAEIATLNALLDISPEDAKNEISNVKLSAEQWEIYAMTKGSSSYNLVTAMLDEEWYQELEDAYKAKCIQLAYRLATSQGKYAAVGAVPTGWTRTLLDADTETGSQGIRDHLEELQQEDLETVANGAITDAVLGGCALKDIQEELENSGWTDREIRKKIRSKITNAHKDGEISDAEAISAYQELGSMTRSEAKKKVQKNKED